MNQFVGGTEINRLLLWFFEGGVFCSLTCRWGVCCWKMVSYIWHLLRTAIPGQRERSLPLYLFRHLVQELCCQLLLQGRLLSIACVRILRKINPGKDRSSALQLQQSHLHLNSHNRKKAFQNSSNKTYSGDLLDKYSVCFIEKQHFTPQILKTSQQSFLLKHRYYNPPSPPRS